MSNDDYLYQDHKEANLDHPDSAIRLACVVHRFRVPKASRKVSLTDAFRSVSKTSVATRNLMELADDARKRLREAGEAKKLSSERVVNDARRYIPLIHTVLLSCRVQPESARLDEKLVFEWTSGVEAAESCTKFKSEAIMYDLTMAIVSEGLGRAAAATECSMAGEFTAAARDYQAAAGIFDFLATDHLPKWISKGSKVDDATLPTECHVPAAAALKTLFHANGQQMAVATLLLKDGTPSYGLLAKLCLGISEQLDEFVSMMRAEAFAQMNRLDQDFFTLITFQINVQQSLSLYFQARALWDKTDYGIAIALMSEATVALRTRDSIASKGVPDVTRTPSLKPLLDDLKDLRAHMAQILRQWEKDNSAVFFCGVPQNVPASKKLQEGLKMNKMHPFALEEVEPVLLQLPEDGESSSPRNLQRTDSDLARELQEKLNAGED